MARIAIIEPL
ncbi:uncharacterized protein FFMR_00544 [Fusarium fujikuroi]|nr:uncharacterized protein FFMR_00544 [Fusarium fujikuroi]